MNDKNDTSVGLRQRRTWRDRLIRSESQSVNIDTRQFPEEYDLTFDGGKRIDFVMAYDPKTAVEGSHLKRARDCFEQSLIDEGLILSYDKSEQGSKWYTLVHAPWEVLSRHADIMKIRMPMKELPDSEVLEIKTWWERLANISKVFTAPFYLDPEVVPPLQRRFTCVYSKDKEYLFDIPQNRDLFFSNPQRSRIVDYILRRKSFSDDPKDTYSFGIRKLINDEVYTDAYPLHEGGYHSDNQPNLRKLLFDHWAAWRNFYKEQPVDYIRNYYGEKVGLYFAWLGFYTMMLFPAALVGVIVFIYGCMTIMLNPIANEICHPDQDIIMCPLCDYRCDFWNLTDACPHARVSYLFDNGATFFFAIFMSIWGTVFLEMWKRSQADIKFRWSLSNFEAEEQPARPEFLAKLGTNCRKKKNYISGMLEPHYPFLRRRLPVFFCSFSVMILLVALAFVFIFGVIVYRMCVLMVLYSYPDELVYRNATMVTSVTAALLNLIAIFILNWIYRKLAEVLTNWENLRTQSEYDDSLTLKLYLLQFVNYYSSLFYIAFLKGRVTGQPTEYNRLFGARQEECMPGGCLIELCLQLFIIMVGKQFAMSAMEIFLPKLKQCVMAWFRKEEGETEEPMKKPWELDQELDDPGPREIFFEYLEMLLQFGFITIFVAAFPLAPLFALLNNIIEIRGDAQKFVCTLRRPVSQRSEDIGIWYDVLYAVSRIAIVSNALIIAVTSDFIPRMVYQENYSADGTAAGYIENSLSYFDVADFENGTAPAESIYNVTTCRYKIYTFPPTGPDKYSYTQQHWHVLAGRVLFVAVFENFVVVLTSIIAWLIPDVPLKLAMIMRRETYITNEIILKTELDRAHGKQPGANFPISLMDMNLIRRRAGPQVESEPPKTPSRPESVHSETCV